METVKVVGHMVYYTMCPTTFVCVLCMRVRGMCTIQLPPSPLYVVYILQFELFTIVYIA